MKIKLILLSFICFSCFSASAQKQQVIIDADTGNEMDDLYAIAAAVLDTNLNILAINSAHFNNTNLLMDSIWHTTPTKNINSVAVSQAFNEKLLTALGNTNIPLLLGANRMIGDPWGGETPRNSEAIQFIIKTAKQFTPQHRLKIITLGALTNVASAIILDSSIVNNIAIYALGAWYNNKKGAWNKSEFNIRNDLNAFDYLLNNKKVLLHMVTCTAATPLLFKRTHTTAQLGNTNIALFNMLRNRWDEVHAAGEWTMWDMAPIYAITHPQWCTQKMVNTPPENTARKIVVYTQIDAQKIKEDFWKKMNRFEQKKSIEEK